MHDDEHNEEHISGFTKIAASAFAAVAVVGVAGTVAYSFWSSYQERQRFGALEQVDVDTPVDLTLGDLYCAAAIKEDGEYNLRVVRSFDESVAIKLTDGRTVRINCADYDPPPTADYRPDF